MTGTTDQEKQTTKKKKQKEPAGEMSFLEHLEELRWHIIRSVIAISVASVVAFIEKDLIFDKIIFAPKRADFWTNRMMAKLAELTNTPSLKINTHELQLISINMSGQFMTHMWTAIVAGIIIASPFIIYEFWRFISPALHDNERRYATGAVFYMSSLFLLGVLFGYYLIVPLSVDFLGSYSISGDVVNQINVLSYISTVTSIVVAGGVVFELPILAFFLSKIGLLTPAFLRRYRRHAYVLLLLISAIITPPDVFSQIMVCIPLVILYEVSIFISWRVNRNAEKMK
jgi:sec-independent protein translocase protein TatC